MKKLIKLNLFLLMLGLFYLEACDTGVQNKGDTIHGNITFVDSNFYSQGGTYAIALYSYTNSPVFSSPPVAIQNISVSNSKTVSYNITYSGGGYYYAAVVWIYNNNNISELPIILGVHGCDTTHNCNNEIAIAFPNYTGHNFDMLSWTDTTKRLY